MASITASNQPSTNHETSDETMEPEETKPPETKHHLKTTKITLSYFMKSQKRTSLMVILRSEM